MPLLSHSSLTTTRYFFFSLPSPASLVSPFPSFFFLFLFLLPFQLRVHLVGVFRDQFARGCAMRRAGSAITESISVAPGDFRELKWNARGESQSSSLRKSFKRDNFLERESKRERDGRKNGKRRRVKFVLAQAKVFTNIFFFLTFQWNFFLHFGIILRMWRQFLKVLFSYSSFFSCFFLNVVFFVTVWNSYIVLL